MEWIPSRLSKENYKKEGENGNEEVRKCFSRWDLLFLNNINTTCLTIEFHKNIFYKKLI